MALINCPECGKEVSDRAQSCPNCAFPLEEQKFDGIVKVKMPPSQGGWLGLASACYIEDAVSGRKLWEGRCKEVAENHLDGPTKVIIKCGTGSNILETTLDPKGNSRYAITQDIGIRMFATYNISRVDIIDSD